MQVHHAVNRTHFTTRQLQTIGLSTPLALLLVACGLDKPESPNWTVDLIVPIANRHVDGSYIASHAGSEYLRWHNDSGLVWAISAELDTLTLLGHLSITPPAASEEFPLGSVRVGTGTSISCQIALADVTPLAAGAVPEVTTSIAAAFPQAQTFDSVAGASGILRVEIENELGVSVDQVTVTLTAGAGSVAVINVAGPISSGETRGVDHEFSGLSLSDDWTATLGFHTAGGTILSAADKYIAVHASFPEGISATYARGAVDAMTRQFEDSLALSTTHSLTETSILSGELVLGLINNTPLPVTVSWEIPEISIFGTPCSGQAVLAPHSSASLPVNLDGAVYAGSGNYSKATVEVSVQSNGSDDGIVEVSSTQTVSYTLLWSELELSSATGTISPTQIETGLLSAAIAWDSGLEDAGLDQWSAYLVLNSSLPLAAQVAGKVTSNTGLNLPFNGSVPASTEAITSIRLPLETNGTVLRPLPGQIQFEGTLTFGGSQQAVCIDASDFVAATIEFDAPAHMYVDDVSLNVEASSVSLSGEDFGDRTGRLKNALVTLSIANRFPLGGVFTLRIAADSLGVDADDALILGPSTISPAATDGAGNAVSVTTSEVTYALDSADLALFEREVVWFAESLTLLGPGQGQPARISAADALDWHAQVRLEMKVDSDVRPWED